MRRKLDASVRRVSMRRSGSQAVKIGVVGLGVMGRQHARVVTTLEGVEFAAACDARPEARAWAEATLRVPFYDDWRALLDQRLDAVINALPTGLHYEVSRALLTGGVHVLVEKPIATTLEEATELVELASARGLVLMVGHVERFNPAVQALQREIATGLLGSIVTMAARRVGIARPTVPGVGVAIDLAIHDIDVFSFLVGGQRGELLFAVAAELEPGHLVEDHVDVLLRYGNAIGSIQANWITPVKVRRLTVTGTGGIAEVDYLKQSLWMSDSAPALIEGPTWNFFAISRESERREVPVVRSEPLYEEIAHFVKCVRDGREPIVDPRAAVEALQLAIAVSQSIQTQPSVSRS